MRTYDALNWATSVGDAFWEAIAEPPAYPRSLQHEAVWSLPLSFISIGGLTIAHVRRYLRSTPWPFEFVDVYRPLHACLIAYRGRGIVFLRADDPPNEQRFSVAHEVGHFLADYLEPRRRAVRYFGNQIVDVLDGRRLPTQQERVDAILAGVGMAGYTHASPLAVDYTSERHLDAESRADLLALVLLAPVDEVRRRVLWKLRSAQREVLSVANQVLQSEFGLPLGPASFYAHLLFGVKPPSVRQWLGFDVRQVAFRPHRRNKI